MIKLNNCAASIPHTRRHVKFIDECREELAKRGIGCEFEVDEDYVGQESWVRIMCSKRDDELVASIVDMVSNRK